MHNLPKIFLFDDDEANIRLYQNSFKDHFTMVGLQNPLLYKSALREDTSAILIDVLMPLMDGLELFEKIHSDANYNGCPVILMSSSSSEEIMLRALDLGSQDFLSRSMKKEEMILRIRNKIDFFKQNRQMFSLGKIKIKLPEFRAYYDNRALEITLTELKILRFLMREFPNFSSREAINKEVWADLSVLPTTLNTHLSNLRNKFPDWEYEIVFVKAKGVGLMIRETAAPLQGLS